MIYVRGIPLFVLLTCMFSFVWAQSLESLIRGSTASYSVNSFVDKDESGNSSPNYTLGESIRMGARPSSNAYIYLFSVRSNGEIIQVLPNGLDPNNYVSAGQAKYFPPQDASYAFTIFAPIGLDKVFALASQTPLDTHAIMEFTSADGYFQASRQGEAAFASRLQTLLAASSSANWTGDVVSYYVGQPTVPTTGVLFVQGNVGYANVYVDGERRGYIAPMTGYFRLEGLSPGPHELLVQADNHNDVRLSFNIVAGQTTELAAIQQSQ